MKMKEDKVGYVMNQISTDISTSSVSVRHLPNKVNITLWNHTLHLLVCRPDILYYHINIVPPNFVQPETAVKKNVTLTFDADFDKVAVEFELMFAAAVVNKIRT